MTDIPLGVYYECTPKADASKIQKSLSKFLNKASKGLGEAFNLVDDLDVAVGEITEAMIAGMAPRLTRLKLVLKGTSLKLILMVLTAMAVAMVTSLASLVLTMATATLVSHTSRGPEREVRLLKAAGHRGPP